MKMYEFKHLYIDSPLTTHVELREHGLDGWFMGGWCDGHIILQREIEGIEKPEVQNVNQNVINKEE